MQVGKAGHGLIVADDSALMRDLLRSQLERSFGAVYLASDGLEALAIARGLHARLILLDYRMPLMNGIETCREIRQLPGYDGVPVVLLTAYDDDRARRDAMRAGASMVVSKPFTAEQLMEAVAPLMAQKEDTAALTDPALVQGRNQLSTRRRIDAALAQRRYVGLAERTMPIRDTWRR